MTIALTGFMGSGKSSVGRELAALTRYPLTDLDTYIETTSGRSIRTIITTQGEPVFREMETAALQALTQAPGQTGSPRILALGGGTLTAPASARIVRERTTCIYLRATVDTLVRNLLLSPGDRPLLAGGDLRTRVASLLAERAATYESTARIILDTDGLSFRQAAERIMAMLGDH